MFRECTLERKNFRQKVLWQSVAIIFISVIIALSFNYLRKDGLPLIATDSSSGNSPGGLTISLDEAKELFFSHSALFLDARPKEFYELGHIAGAKNLPYEEFESKFPEVMKEVDKGTMIITYCDGEHCELSRELALALMDKGYMNVYVLENGWTLWKKANLPTEAPNQRSISGNAK